MCDKTSIKTFGPQETANAGTSLAQTLYGSPLTIGLHGPLGAGKTTFLQGFAEALGVPVRLVSPTYALEQRYESARGTLSHIDLYRLTDTQAREFLDSTEPESGIRVVEWIDKAGGGHTDIDIEIKESASLDERLLRCSFHDATLLSEGTVEQWRHDMCLPPHIGRHCDAVAAMCDRLAAALTERGMLIRAHTLHQAARCHDLFRFVDFHPGGSPPDSPPPSDDQVRTWNEWRQAFTGLHHEAACASFLRKNGLPVHAAIVETHGVRIPPGAQSTIEQKILYYADKRLIIDRVVTLQERFDDFAKRYAGGSMSEDQYIWFDQAKAVEIELFPNGVPA